MLDRYFFFNGSVCQPIISFVVSLTKNNIGRPKVVCSFDQSIDTSYVFQLYAQSLSDALSELFDELVKTQMTRGNPTAIDLIVLPGSGLLLSVTKKKKKRDSE
jgi:hypothetical protein